MVNNICVRQMTTIMVIYNG